MSKRRPSLVEFEGILVIQLQLWILTSLQKQANADRKDVQFSVHKTAKDLLGRPNDGLTANIESGIDHDRAVCSRLERTVQRVIPWICVGVHSLNAIQLK